MTGKEGSNTNHWSTAVMYKTILFCLSIVLIITLSGCAVHDKYNPAVFTEFETALKDEYDCVEDVELTIIRGPGFLNMDCTMSEDVVFSDVYDVYERLVSFLSSEELISEYLLKIGSEYSYAPPEEPIITVNSGPHIYLYMHVADREEYLYLTAVHFTKRVFFEEEYGEGEWKYVYNGFPGFQDESFFHKMDITAESYAVNLQELPADLAVCDFDDDGFEESAYIVDNEDGIQLYLLDSSSTLDSGMEKRNLRTIS